MADKIELTDREREIMECLINAWDENGAGLYGGYSYGEAFEFLARFGFDPPAKTSAFIDWANKEMAKRREDKED